MPAKGQTCRNCAGTCCTSGVAYSFNGKKPTWFKGSRHIRHSTLISLGAVEFSLKEIKKDSDPEDFVCSSFKDGCCSNYKNRPVLCKSYYCHGRLWKKKIEE